MYLFLVEVSLIPDIVVADERPLPDKTERAVNEMQVPKHGMDKWGTMQDV